MSVATGTYQSRLALLGSVSREQVQAEDAPVSGVGVADQPGPGPEPQGRPREDCECEGQ